MWLCGSPFDDPYCFKWPDKSIRYAHGGHKLFGFIFQDDYCCILQSIQYYTLTYFCHKLIINGKCQMPSPNE